MDILDFWSGFKKAVKTGDAKKAVLVLFDYINDGRIELVELSFDGKKLDYEYKYDFGNGNRGVVKSYNPLGENTPEDTIISLSQGLEGKLSERGELKVDPVADQIYDYFQENNFGSSNSILFIAGIIGLGLFLMRKK